MDKKSNKNIKKRPFSTTVKKNVKTKTTGYANKSLRSGFGTKTDGTKKLKKKQVIKKKLTIKMLN